jgi:hypothetical protein
VSDTTYQGPEGEEPDPTALPDKPPITDPMPSDSELEQMDEPGEEDVPEEQFLDPDTAAADDTVDDAERDE